LGTAGREIFCVARRLEGGHGRYNGIKRPDADRFAVMASAPGQ